MVLVRRRGLAIYHYAFRLHRVIDGDTVVLDWDLGGPNSGVWVHKVEFRLARINAPEKRFKIGKVAMAFLIEYLQGKVLSGRTFRVKDMEGQEKSKKDVYGRWIVDLEADGIPVSDYMVQTGHAKYHDY